VMMMMMVLVQYGNIDIAGLWYFFFFFSFFFSFFLRISRLYLTRTFTLISNDV